MPDPSTYDPKHTPVYVWLDERLQQLADNQLDSHKRLREEMLHGFTEIRQSFENIRQASIKLNERTLVIETERRMERREGMKTGAMWGAIAGACTSTGLGVILHLVKLL